MICPKCGDSIRRERGDRWVSRQFSACPGRHRPVDLQNKEEVLAWLSM